MTDSIPTKLREKSWDTITPPSMAVHGTTVGIKKQQKSFSTFNYTFNYNTGPVKLNKKFHWPVSCYKVLSKKA